MPSKKLLKIYLFLNADQCSERKTTQSNQPYNSLSGPSVGWPPPSLVSVDSVCCYTTALRDQWLFSRENWEKNTIGAAYGMSVCRASVGALSGGFSVGTVCHKCIQSRGNVWEVMSKVCCLGSCKGIGALGARVSLK